MPNPDREVAFASFVYPEQVITLVLNEFWCYLLLLKWASILPPSLTHSYCFFSLSQCPELYTCLIKWVVQPVECVSLIFLSEIYWFNFLRPLTQTIPAVSQFKLFNKQHLRDDWFLALCSWNTLKTPWLLFLFWVDKREIQPLAALAYETSLSKK